MIYIFHGNHTVQSYTSFSDLLNNYKLYEKFNQNNKNLDIDALNRFINSPSLFSETKVVIIQNLFSLLKSQLEQVAKLVNSNPKLDYLFWQDKNIEPAKLKLFPNSSIKSFALPDVLFSCLNSIRPKNKNEFVKKYEDLISVLPFELTLFWFKNSLRRQLVTYSKFSPDNLKTTYKNLIKLDYLTKTGAMLEPKEFALEKLILSLIDSGT